MQLLALYPNHVRCQTLTGVGMDFCGALQFEVLADRIRAEYGIPVRFESAGLHTARWIDAKTERDLKLFQEKNRSAFAEDHDGSAVFLARNAWHLTHTAEQFPELSFKATKD